MMLSTCACTETSSADVGSSQTRNSGCVASARAIEMRCRWPPENWCGNFSASAAARPTERSSSATRSASCRSFSPSGGLGEAVLAQRLGDDVEHLPARIEARVRVLEDHLHAPAQRAVGRAARGWSSTPSKTIRPRVGAYRPTSSRATVLLPQPDSPTSASVLPRSIAKADAVDRVHELARLALDHAVEPRRARRRRSSPGLRPRPAARSLDRHGAHAAAFSRRACSQHAARVAPAGSRSGRSTRQRSNDVRAARIEGAAGRDRGQARHRAVDLQQPLAVLVHRRDRAHQADGVGMRRRSG